MHELVISAVAFKEGDSWVVQGIEYDIAAHANDPSDLPKALCRALAENFCITQALGRQPMEGVKPAPARFRELFNKARTTLGSVTSLNSPIPVGAMNIRLAHAEH